jgi:hypothetical protein
MAICLEDAVQTACSPVVAQHDGCVLELSGKSPSPCYGQRSPSRSGSKAPVRRTAQFYVHIDRAYSTTGPLLSASIVAHCAAASPLVLVAPQRRHPTVLPEARTCPARSRPRASSASKLATLRTQKLDDILSVTPGKMVVDL